MKMRIDIAKEDLWWVRYLIDYSVRDIESKPNAETLSEPISKGRKMNRKLNQAIKKSYGHDQFGEHYRT